MDTCYNNSYSFSKYTTMTRGNFLYLIGIIGQTILCVKILFVHVNVFVIKLDAWHIIKILNEIITFNWYDWTNNVTC